MIGCPTTIQIFVLHLRRVKSNLEQDVVIIYIDMWQYLKKIKYAICLNVLIEISFFFVGFV